VLLEALQSQNQRFHILWAIRWFAAGTANVPNPACDTLVKLLQALLPRGTQAQRSYYFSANFLARPTRGFALDVESKSRNTNLLTFRS